jgi:hypothetical protein
LVLNPAFNRCHTFNLALLAATHPEQSHRLYTSHLTAPTEWRPMATIDLDDLLHLYHTPAQQTKQLLQVAILQSSSIANDASQTQNGLESN